jgi:hypothetical protein
MAPLDSRRLKLLRDPANWLALMQDVAWKASRSRAPRPEPTWPLAPKDLADVRIRWPLRYENPLASSMFDFALRRFREIAHVDEIDLPQVEPGLTTFVLEIGSQEHLIAIDYYDFAHINEGTAAQCSIYFKMQHREEGYGHVNVVPGGYVAKRSLLYDFLPRLRALRDARDFSFDVYGRFSLTFQPEVRGRIYDLLSTQDDFSFEGATKVAVYSRHLRDVARSRICIDVPGQGPLCHRLVDSLAIGSCVVGIRPKAVLPVPLEDGEHAVWIRDDLGDLVDRCRDQLSSVDETEGLARNAREYFDRFLHRDQLADYYLHTCLQRLR